MDNEREQGTETDIARGSEFISVIYLEIHVAARNPGASAIPFPDIRPHTSLINRNGWVV
jgi:hypothetical protein